MDHSSSLRVSSNFWEEMASMVCPKLIMGEGVALSSCSHCGLILACFPGVTLLPSLYLGLGKDLERKRGTVGGQMLLLPGLAWRQTLAFESSCYQVGSSGLGVSGKDFIRCRSFQKTDGLDSLGGFSIFER